ncbi:Amino-acid acetyltransferase [Psychrobacter phenylpyruvicus]|uniref:Amino-acid acetyltransferase n=1 Tax=Psychrobacter phenylpyruvicus TaxID=29432 RepID=A0A379LPM6_9GAMM|nr:Amino-acid acetyltransferase [Psychrobacter phenylpyruvicus]
MNDTAMPQITPDYVHWFRNSAPYINTHRGKTFVIMFGGEAVNHPNFSNLIHDFALLHSLGIKLVLVHGARPQIEKNLAKFEFDSPLHNDIRVTPREAMPTILEAVGAIRLQIEAQLSMGLANSQCMAHVSMLYPGTSLQRDLMVSEMVLTTR